MKATPPPYRHQRPYPARQGAQHEEESTDQIVALATSTGRLAVDAILY
jgi:hypothetical protein